MLVWIHRIVHGVHKLANATSELKANPEAMVDCAVCGIEGEPGESAKCGVCGAVLPEAKPVFEAVPDVEYEKSLALRGKKFVASVKADAVRREAEENAAPEVVEGDATPALEPRECRVVPVVEIVSSPEKPEAVKVEGRVVPGIVDVMSVTDIAVLREAEAYWTEVFKYRLGVDETSREYWFGSLVPAFERRRRALDFFERVSGYKIRNKKGQIVNFEPKPHQRDIYEAAMAQRGRGEPIRQCILKPRQVGDSTAVALWNYDDLQQNKDKQMMVVSLNQGSANHIAGMIERANARDDGEGVARLNKSRNDFTFGGKKSFCEYSGGLSVLSGWKEFGANSFTYQNAQFDEIAKWRAAAETIASMTQSIPHDVESAIFALSTAEGYGYHRDLWYGKDDGYVRLFMPWFQEPGYRLPFKDDDEKQRFEENLDAAAREYKIRFNLELEQLKWRDMKLKTDFLGAPELFKQEYPAEPDEAFLGSGVRYFDFSFEDTAKKIEVVKQERRYGKYRYNFDTEKIEASSYGDIIVYHKPKDGWVYVMGADPAEGKSAEGKAAGAVKSEGAEDRSDRSVIQVVGRKMEGGKILETDCVQVAEYAGRIGLRDFATMIRVIGKWYKRAYVLWERIGGGQVVFDQLNEKYHNRMCRMPNFRTDNRKFDPSAPPVVQPYGWIVSPNSRKIMLETLSEYLRTGELTIYSEELLKECLAFQRDAAGKGIMPRGLHDDRIFALALAIQCVRHAPKVRPAGSYESEGVEKAIDRIRGMEKLKKVGDYYDGYTVVG